MYRPRIIPVLLLKNKGLVKTVQFKKTTYIGDPINAVKIFNDKEADELIFLDIHASKENRCIDVHLVKNIADEAYMPFAVGGGIKDIKSAIELIQAGAEKIIINSAFVNNPKFVKELANEIGNQSVVVCCDVKKNWLGKWYAYTHSGSKNTKLSPVDFAKLAEQNGAGEFMLQFIDNDGMMEGYNLEMINNLSSVIKIPLIACGGAGKIDHMQSALKVGATAIAAGSLFVYQGSHKAVLINYPEKSNLNSKLN